MKKIEAHLKELKKIALDEYKQYIKDEQIKQTEPLINELEHLKAEFERKKKTIEAEKLQIKNAKSAYVKRQEQEIKAYFLIDKIWKEVIKNFFKQHSTEFVKSSVSNLPSEKGVIIYNPEGFMKQELTLLKKLRSDLTYKEDKNMSEGFIYSNEKIEVNCTVQAFSENKLRELKSQIYSQLKNLKVV